MQPRIKVTELRYIRARGIAGLEHYPTRIATGGTLANSGEFRWRKLTYAERLSVRLSLVKSTLAPSERVFGNLTPSLIWAAPFAPPGAVIREVPDIWVRRSRLRKSSVPEILAAHPHLGITPRHGVVTLFGYGIQEGV